ncbi:hypothetical protein M408DRAFT_27567, partial [Serendipita vermifera MAFF 305830]
MSDVSAQDMLERRDSATDIVAEFEAGNLLRLQAIAGLVNIFNDLGGADLEAAMAPFVQALDDI